MISSPKDSLSQILERIDQSARKGGRQGKDITLIAVTKKIPFSKVVPYLQAGIQDVGENRVQEAVEKYSELRTQGSGIGRLHLIGPLQTNKAKKAVEFFDVIQSLDRWELAENLNRHAGEQGKKLECLIQIKISDEPTKSGLMPRELPEFLSRVSVLPHLVLRGLMGIPPANATAEAARPYFQQLRRLFQDARVGGHAWNALSMGMSSDFEAAIEEGSTWVRIGTALFGAR